MIKNTILWCKVKGVNEDGETLDIILPEAYGSQIIFKVKVGGQKSGSVETQNIPGAGSTVCVVWDNLTIPAVLGGGYSSGHPRPFDTPEIIGIKHDDVEIKYDPSVKKLSATGLTSAAIEASAMVDVSAPIITADAGASGVINATASLVTITGNLTVTGTINGAAVVAAGAITGATVAAGAVDLATVDAFGSVHVHPVTTAPGTTGSPAAP